MRKVDGRNESNGSTWRVVANGGHGSDDGLRGGNPLRVADRLDDVNRRGIWEWVETGWWTQWVKTTVGVAGAVPGGSCGGVGSRAVAWGLWTVVAMVAAAERAPRVSNARAEFGQVTRTVGDWRGWDYRGFGHWFLDAYGGFRVHRDGTEADGLVDVPCPVE